MNISDIERELVGLTSSAVPTTSDGIVCTVGMKVYPTYKDYLDRLTDIFPGAETFADVVDTLVQQGKTRAEVNAEMLADWRSFTPYTVTAILPPDQVTLQGSGKDASSGSELASHLLSEQGFQRALNPKPAAPNVSLAPTRQTPLDYIRKQLGGMSTERVAFIGIAGVIGLALFAHWARGRG